MSCQHIAPLGRGRVGKRPALCLQGEITMITRRRFIKVLSSLTTTTLLAGARGSFATANSNTSKWFMPDESAPHLRTWMAFGASQKIWGRKLLPKAQRNLATIALTIAKYEPVSMLVRQTDLPVPARRPVHRCGS